MVTSYKMSESEMDYRGSKSVLINTVKEQRVDGSYLGYIKSPKLRCTLMGNENYYQINVPSKQTLKFMLQSSASNINFSSYRKFSFSSSVSALLRSSATKQVNQLNEKLDPWFLTGFTDAEGSCASQRIIF
jgi:hypothetical protein